eukprot:TRINITY_DN23449_c0_g1_i1.p1 TRINITY_DN23449_c0_g1~~TRINITY_DN23449_c0_g1_i1.p1  ORF type:complete len:733 (+),score=53.40 TRINITY_DN23449_c0_g1_i1:49-2247(+)
MMLSHASGNEAGAFASGLAGSASSAAATASAADESWDPLTTLSQTAHRQPTTTCLKRLASELVSMRNEPMPGIWVCPNGCVATMLHALIAGPADTPYDGGLFHFVFDVPDRYPQAPPRVRLLTTGGAAVRFNPQFYTNGKVCLSILHTWNGPGWQPSFTLRVVLLQLQTLMNEMPALNEPGVMLMPDPEDYNTFLRHETIRVAALGIAHEALASLAEEGSDCRPLHGLSPPAPPLQEPSLRLHPALARDALEHVQKQAGRLEERCRTAAVALPEGTALPGVPSPVRAQYAAMARVFGKLVAQPATDGRNDDGQAASEAAVSAQAIECRICNGGPDDGEILRPCGCAGTMAFVHRRCAVEWVTRTQSPQCPICRQRYSDVALRTLGTIGRYKRFFSHAVRSVRLLAVVCSCFALVAVFGETMRMSQIKSADLWRWTVQPGVSHRSRYVLRDRQLVHADRLSLRWHNSIVDRVVIHHPSPWRKKHVPVPISVGALIEHADCTQRKGSLRGHTCAPPQSLRRLLDRYSRKTLMRHVAGSRGHLKLRALLRAGVAPILEPRPSISLCKAPSCAARVAIVAALFAWLCTGRRTLLWVVLCCQISLRFIPAPLVFTLAFGGPVLGHQMRKRLAMRGLLRPRPPAEADALIIVVLLAAGQCCAHSARAATADGFGLALYVWSVTSWLVLVAFVVFTLGTLTRWPDDASFSALAKTFYCTSAFLLACVFLCAAVASPLFF